MFLKFFSSNTASNFSMDEEEHDSLQLLASGAATDASLSLFRLFVGWVPKLFTEADLKPLFDQWGTVQDIIVLKDKTTGQPRGCAFVSYATREEAEAAIQHLDRRVQLPGALSKLEVRFARSHQYIQAGAGPEDNRQLFFTRAPLTATEADFMALFSRFGTVEEVNLFRERRSNISKGCGFVLMATRDQALAVMETLDERHLMDQAVTPLSIKWADPELQIKKRRAVEESNTENRMLFFAKVLRSASEDEVRALFGRFGRVFEVNLFRAFQGAPTTKGCGLVTMGSNEEASAAIEALDQRFTWEGMDAPMVVKWMDAALQKRRREEHLAAMRQGLVPSMGGTPRQDLWSGSNTMSSGSLGSFGGLMASGSAGLRAQGASGSGAAGYLQQQPGGGASPYDSGGGAGGSALVYPVEVPPPGCAPDAYKLFVGNLPKSYSEEDLRPLFESIGQVVELVVVRDKFTHESKGSAFVWYRTAADADRAALQLNVRHVLPSPSGEQERPIVVRRANTRKPAAPAAAPYGSAQAASAGGFVPAGLVQAGVMQAPPGAAVAATGMEQVFVYGPASGSGVCGGPREPGLVMQGVQVQPFMLQAAGAPPGAQMAAAVPQAGGQHVLYQPVYIDGNGMVGAGSSMQRFVPFGDADAALSSGGNAMAQQGCMTPVLTTVASTTYNSSGEALTAGTAAMSGANTGSRASGASGNGDQGGAVLVGSAPDRSGGMAVRIPLSSNQMAVMTQHVFSIQAMSGADVTSQAVAPGVFCLLVSGGKTQVEMANQLVSSVLQNTAI